VKTQAPVKVSNATKERIRYVAALTNISQTEVVERAVTEYAARHADEIARGMQRARAALASGDAAIAAYLLDEPLENVEGVAGLQPSS